MKWVINTCIVIVAIIHLLPLVGVLGVERLQSLYGIRIDGPEIEILMRHRAVLFGLLGAGLVASLWQPEYQGIAMLAGAVSVVSFLAIALSTREFNHELARVVMTDWIALIAVIVGGVCWIVLRRGLN